MEWVFSELHCANQIDQFIYWSLNQILSDTDNMLQFFFVYHEIAQLHLFDYYSASPGASLLFFVWRDKNTVRYKDLRVELWSDVSDGIP